MVRNHYDPILEVGQSTRSTHAFPLYDESGTDPGRMDLTDAAEVRLTMEHRDWGGTVVEAEPCTIPESTASQGVVEYTFSPEETRYYGTHFIQFEVEWMDGTTQLAPVDGGDGTLYVGRRLPRDGPLRVSNAVVDSLNVSELTGGIAGNDPITGTLYGPGLVNDAGDLAVSIDAGDIDGLTNPLTAHLDANGYDILNPRDVGKDATRARHVYTQGLTAGSATVETAPTASGEVARWDETQANAEDIGTLQTDVNTLDTDKADADGAGTAELTNYAFIDTDRVQPGRTEYGENPAETVSGTGATLSFSATDGRDVHDSTDVTISNGTTGSVTEDVTVDYYEGADATGTLLASGTRSITLSAGASTTETFLLGDFALGTGDHYLEVSTTNLTADGIDEHTLGLQYATERATNGDLVTTDQSGQERARYEALGGGVSFPAVETDSVSSQSVETDEARITIPPDERVVRVPSDYPTIHQAIQGEAARVDAGSTVVRVLAESGHHIQERIECREGVWNHFKIDSENRPLPVSSDFPVDEDIIKVVDGALGPTLRTLIDAQGYGEDGVNIERGAHMKIFSTEGVINAGRHCLQVKRASVTGASSIWNGAGDTNIALIEGSVGHLGGVTANNAAVHGIRLQRGATGDFSRGGKPCEVTGNGSMGIWATEASTANVEGGDLSNNSSVGVRCGGASHICASGATVQNSGGYDVRNDNGGIIDVTGCQTTNGTPALADVTTPEFNTLASRGIIFEDS